MSILNNAVVLGAVAAGVGALGYYGEGAVDQIVNIDGLPKAVQKALGGSLEFVTKNVNCVGETIGGFLPNAIAADERMKSAIGAGLAALAAGGAGAMLLGAMNQGQNLPNPGGIPAGLAPNGPTRYS